MGVLAKLTIKYMESKPKRTIITLIGLVTSISMIIVVLSTISSYSSTSTSTQLVGPDYGDFTVQSCDEQLYRKILTTKNISKLAKTKDDKNLIDYRVDNNDIGKFTNIVMKDVDKEYFNSFIKNKIVEGRLPQKEGEAIVPYDIKNIALTLSELNSQVRYPTVNGKDLTAFREDVIYSNRYDKKEINQILDNILMDGFPEFIRSNYKTTDEGYGTEEFKIVGYFAGQSFSYSSTQDTSIAEKFDRKYDYYETTIYRLSDMSSQEVFNLEGLYTTYEHMDETAATINNLADGSQSNSTFKSNEYTTEIKENRTLKEWGFYEYFVYFVIIFKLIVASIFILNVFITNYVEKVRDMGLLKVVGLTNKQLIKLVLLESIIYVIIAFPLGLALSQILMYLTNKFINYVINSNLAAIYINYVYTPEIGIILISLILTIIIVFISEIIASYYVLRSSPVKSVAINYSESEFSKSKKKHAFVKKLFGYEGFLSVRNMGRNKFRFVVSTSAIVVSITIYVLFSYMSSTFDMQQVKTIAGKDASYGVVVSGDHTRTDDFIDDLEDLGDIKATNRTSYIETMASDDHGRYSDSSHLLIIFKDELFNDLFSEFANYNHIVMVSADNKDIDTDDKPIYFSDIAKEDDRNTRFYTQRITSNEPSVVEFMRSINNYDNIYIIRKSDSYSLSKELKNGINDIVEISKNDDNPMISENIKGLLVKYPTISIKGYIQPSIKIIKVISNAFIFQIALIAVLSIINSTFGNISIRKRELALIEAVGVESKAMRKIVLYENLFSLIIASIVSLGLSYLGSYFIYLTQEKELEIFNVKYLFPYKYYILGTVSAFILVIGFSLLSFRDARKQSTIQVLKYE